MTVTLVPKSEIDSKKRPDHAVLQRIRAFTPYSEIDREWRRYQRKLAGVSAPVSEPAFVAAASH